MTIGFGFAIVEAGGVVIPPNVVQKIASPVPSCHVIGRGAAHDRLVIVVGQRVLVRELLPDRYVAVLDIVESQRVAA